MTTRVQFGPGASGAVAQAAGELGIDRLLLVTDPGVLAAGLVQPILAALKSGGAAVVVFSSVSGNPRDHECAAACAAGREAGVEGVLGVGGGSALDVAKTVAALLTNGGAARDWEFPRSLERDPLPIIAIPTTAGTGSEVTRYAVVTDTERRFKMSLFDDRLAPRIALVDPLLTHSVPPAVTAATGMDALTHAIEAFTGNLANPITDALALDAIGLVAENLAPAVRDGGNEEARSRMMLASLLAGMAFGATDVAAVHCLAEAIGGRYDTPHGVANSVFLPIVFAHNAEAFPERHARVAVALGVPVGTIDPEQAATAGAGLLAGLARSVGIPRLRDLAGVSVADFPALALAAERNVSNPSNCRPLDTAAYEALLERAWNV